MVDLAFQFIWLVYQTCLSSVHMVGGWSLTPEWRASWMLFAAKYMA
jgi:hypothetical protein